MLLKKEKRYMNITNHYKNLLSQAEKIRRHNHQGSYKTKERYYEAFKRFLRYVADEYRLEKLANISGKHIESYIEYMQDRELSASTIKTDLAAIRFWHDQIPNAKYTLPNNDEFELEQRKFGEVDRTWSNLEFTKMLNACMELKRNDYEACIVIARYAGLRLHEVFRIDTAIARAALKNGYITIKGKNGLIRDVPLNYTIQIEFEKFLKITPPGYKLFVPKSTQTHIAMRELQNFISTHRKTVQDSDSTHPMTFHGLRHTFAAESYKDLIQKGKSKYEARKQVSLLLGHKRDDVTKNYLASIDDEKKGGDCNV
jgi:site-specific recombinase XerD